MNSERRTQDPSKSLKKTPFFRQKDGQHIGGNVIQRLFFSLFLPDFLFMIKSKMVAKMVSIFGDVTDLQERYHL